jgi:LDH2 family malate/lactate/ureidoglycolate dehydrogenase
VRDIANTAVARGKIYYASERGEAIPEGWATNIDGVLTGSSVGSSIAAPDDPDGRSGCGHLLICIDIRSAADSAEFERRMEALIEEIKAASTAAGVAEGITLADETWSPL